MSGPLTDAELSKITENLFSPYRDSMGDTHRLLAEVRRLQAENERLQRLRDVKNRICEKWLECPSLNIGRTPADGGYADFEELEDLILELFE